MNRELHSQHQNYSVAATALHWTLTPNEYVTAVGSISAKAMVIVFPIYVRITLLLGRWKTNSDINKRPPLLRDALMFTPNNLLTFFYCHFSFSHFPLPRTAHPPKQFPMFWLFTIWFLSDICRRTPCYLPHILLATQHLVLCDTVRLLPVTPHSSAVLELCFVAGNLYSGIESFLLVFRFHTVFCSSWRVINK